MKRIIPIIAIGLIAWILGSGNPRPMGPDDPHPDRSIHER